MVMLDACLAGEPLTAATPSADDVRIIQESSRKLEKILDACNAEIQIRIQPEN